MNQTSDIKSAECDESSTTNGQCQKKETNSMSEQCEF